MVNKNKIVTMTNLALYDKHEGDSDREANKYFRHDYIYRKNLGTRLSVGLGGLIILAIYWFRVVFIDGVDVFELYMRTHVINAIIFLVVLMVIYSVVGTIQGTREYYLIQKRLERYQAMMGYLERLDERGRMKVNTETEERVIKKAPRVVEETRKAPRVTQETRPINENERSTLRRRVRSEGSRYADATKSSSTARRATSPGDAPLVRLKRSED